MRVGQSQRTGCPVLYLLQTNEHCILTQRSLNWWQGWKTGSVIDYLAEDAPHNDTQSVGRRDRHLLQHIFALK